MIGDKLLITDYHRQSAALIYEKLAGILLKSKSPVVVTVAGESGCGKSETAAVLAELCTGKGYRALILQQDDYFVYPPQTNHKKRLEDISWVGPQEVKLDLIENNIADIKNGNKRVVSKPLVIFDQDRITEETVSIEEVDVVIVEGTYTTILKKVDLKAFINRDFRQTKKARLERSRDAATDFLEKVLLIEHDIISTHKELADIVLPPPVNENNH